MRAGISDSLFGLGTFRDYPFWIWGYEGDWAYQLEQDLTTDKTTWTNAVNAMVASGGYDEPESQYEALYQAATGAGRDVPPTGVSPGDVAAGQDVSFREDATSVIAITTDAPFHTPGDSSCISPDPPCPFLYPGPSKADTIAALIANNIKVIAIKAPGSGSEMDDLATATGGAVAYTDDTSTEIAEAILGAFEELTFNITAEVEGCDPLIITFDPEYYEDILGGDSVVFEETITVPEGITKEDLPPDGRIECEVVFKADDTEIGRQSISIQVVFTPIDIKPQSCPNPVNVASKGVLPVAIVSTEDFDATTVDPSTVELEGVAPLRSGIEDVATPFDPYLISDCMDCTTAGPDGMDDLTLKFKTQDIVEAMGDVYNRECKVLRLTGSTYDGELIVGEDVVIILKNK